MAVNNETGVITDLPAIALCTTSTDSFNCRWSSLVRKEKISLPAGVSAKLFFFSGHKIHAPDIKRTGFAFPAAEILEFPYFRSGKSRI